MSGFFGIFRPQGGPVDLEAFEQMKTAMLRDGFDGMETHVEDKIAMGHLMLRVSPESKYDKQPLKSSCGNYILVGHFRLDYRDELGDKLGLTQSELELTPDSQLAMLAYQKWKEKCVHHLEGDWAFVVFNRIKNDLRIFRDSIGHSTIFYYTLGNDFFFSSSIELIVSKNIYEVELDLLQLKLLSLNHCELTEGKTLFKNIFILKNGFSLWINENLFFFEIKYWELTNTPSLKYLYEEDVITDFMSIYSKSIYTRLRSIEDVALFLSSGLDSSSIAYFASTHLKYNSKKLVTYTSYPQYISEIADDKIIKAREDLQVRNFVENNANIESHFLNFENKSISDLFVSEKLNNYDPIIMNNTFWINGILEQAKLNGSKIILSGQLGNASLTWNAPYLTFSKFANFQFRDLVFRLKKMSQKYNVSLLTVFWYDVLKPLKLFCRFKLNFGEYKNSIFDSTVFIKSSFEKEFDLRDLGGLNYVPGFSFFLSDEKYRHAFFKNISNNSGVKWYLLGQSYGIETTDPTSDKRLIEFTFRISEDFFNYFGDSKYIFKKMMRDRLPDYILYNKIPSVQAYDIGLRITNDDNFSKMIENFKKVKKFNQELNCSLIDSQYQELSSSEDLVKKFRYSSKILKNLSILNFLRKYS